MTPTTVRISSPFFFLLIFTYLCNFVEGAEIFVRSGATGGNGTSAIPYGSIQQALTAASTNDIITLYNGTYTGTSNTVLSLGSLTNITIRGFDNNPLTTIIQWSGNSADSFLNITKSSPTIRIQGLGFSSRVLVDNPNYLPNGGPTPTIYLGSGSLNIVNCRFSDFSTTSIQGLEVLYVLVKGGSTANFTSSDFLRGQGLLGISLEDGKVAITSCNFVLHTVGTFGSCAAIRLGNNTEPANMTITNTNFVSSSTPVRFTKGTAVLSSNNFYNCTNISPSCTNAIITSTGNKFCGSSVGTCAQLSVSNIRPFDGCGICDGTNIHKDCTGVCWGTSQGSSCPTKKTIWVSPTGGGDGTARNKTLSISAAISQANYGDTIILLSGNYSGGITTAGRTGITIRSENGLPDYDNVTITCSASNKNAFTFSNQESFDNVLQGFTITNCGNGTASAVFIGANTGITIRSVKFHLNGDLLSSGAAIYLLDGFVRVTDVTFQNNTANRGSIVYGNTSNFVTKATYFSATNTRFINNYVADRGNIHFNGGLIEISNSYFIYGDAFVQTASIYSNTTYLAIVNNSFSNVGLSAGSPRNIECNYPRSDSTQSLNTFCGSASTASNLCSVFGTQTLSGTPDACGVCNGNNATRDCSGTCFGSQSKDNKTACCFSPSRDCGGYCYGPNRLDVNSTCCNSSLIDACNICGGDDSCLCDLNYNPFAPVCRNNGTCTPAPKVVVYGSFCNCSLTGGYFGFNCTDFNCTSPCETRGNCTAPNYCTCNTTLWVGSDTGCNTPVCSGDQYCADRGNCTAPGVCNCNTTMWSGSLSGCRTPVCYGTQDCGERGNCTSPGICNCNTTLWTGSTTGCNTPVCSGDQDCGNRGSCVAPGKCACNVTSWTGDTTGCRTPVCSGLQDCGDRGNCTAPGQCTCNTTEWIGADTGCNTPVCSGDKDCGNRGSCVAPGFCACNATAWTGDTTGCQTPVCSGLQDCGDRGNCTAPGQCNCNTTQWIGNTTGCNTPVCSGDQDCGERGSCVAPGKCACNTTAWTGNTTGCQTPVCSGLQDCQDRGNCTAPNFCTCNTTLWTGNTTGCTTAVCSYPATTICNGGYCISPGVCSCDGTNYTQACPVIPSVSTTPSRSPSRSPTPSLTPSPSSTSSVTPSPTSFASPTSTPSTAASPSISASSSPTNSPASSVAASPSAFASSSTAPSISPSSSDTTSSSGHEKGNGSTVQGSVLYAIVVIGAIALLALLVATVAFVWRRRRSGIDADADIQLEMPSQ